MCLVFSLTFPLGSLGGTNRSTRKSYIYKTLIAQPFQHLIIISPAVSLKHIDLINSHKWKTSRLSRDLKITTNHELKSCDWVFVTARLRERDKTSFCDATGAEKRCQKEGGHVSRCSQWHDEICDNILRKSRALSRRGVLEAEVWRQVETHEM